MKTIRKVFGIALSLIAAAFLFQACSDDDNSASGLNITADGDSISAIAFKSTESSKMISVNTDGNWTASVPDADTTWLHITPHSGYGWNYKDSASTNRNSYIRVSVTTNMEGSRQSTITINAGGLTRQITVTQEGQSLDPGDPFGNVWSMVSELKMGYNLGNTLDSNPSTKESWWADKIKGLSGRALANAYETSWGQPLTTQAMIDQIHEQGFNIIRVPVSWRPHMDADNNIDTAWMNRVQEVVDYALKDSGYVILNVMHDVGDSKSSKSVWMLADPDTYAANTVIYQKIWRQIAERFKNYDKHLIFESFNEILDKNNNWTAPAAGDPAYEVINKFQQDFVNTVRATGGNNEWRFLAVTTYAATANTAVPLSEFKLPTDIHPHKIYATVHSYDPYNFCNSNKSSEHDYNKYTFDAECRATIDQVINNCVTRFQNELGIPFIFGEFGAIDKDKDMNERVSYATYVSEKLKANRSTGLWWMGLYDRSANNWYESRIVDALRAGFGIK